MLYAAESGSAPCHLLDLKTIHPIGSDLAQTKTHHNTEQLPAPLKVIIDETLSSPVVNSDDLDLCLSYQ
jgi:hypothetical protein